MLQKLLSLLDTTVHTVGERSIVPWAIYDLCTFWDSQESRAPCHLGSWTHSYKAGSYKWNTGSDDVWIQGSPSGATKHCWSQGVGQNPPLELPSCRSPWGEGPVLIWIRFIRRTSVNSLVLDIVAVGTIEGYNSASAKYVNLYCEKFEMLMHRYGCLQI